MMVSMKRHVEYIRSLEDSRRVREACLKYFQNWLVYFFPERPDLVKELETMAAEVGGKLVRPALRAKYAWLAPFVGFARAKRLQFALPDFKAGVLRRFEWLRYAVERRFAI
jgi:hypothetical protein